MSGRCPRAGWLSVSGKCSRGSGPRDDADVGNAGKDPLSDLIVRVERLVRVAGRLDVGDRHRHPEWAWELTHDIDPFVLIVERYSTSLNCDGKHLWYFRWSITIFSKSTFTVKAGMHTIRHTI